MFTNHSTGTLPLGKKKWEREFMCLFLHLWFIAESEPKINSDVDNIANYGDLFFGTAFLFHSSSLKILTINGSLELYSNGIQWTPLVIFSM